VFATFQAATVSAEREVPGAAAVLCLAGHFAPDTIPEELFRQNAEVYPEELRLTLPGTSASVRGLRATVADPSGVDEALGTLNRFSLIDYETTTRTFTVHRLVQAAARDLLGDATVRWVECAVAALNAAFPNPQKHRNWIECERLLSHAQAAAKLIVEHDLISEVAARLLNQTAYYLSEPARYAEAQPLYERELAIWEKALGPDHPDVATSLNNLALLYYAQGRYGEAQPRCERALAIREKALGPDHPDVATSLNNLAGLCDSQGLCGEAAALRARASGDRGG
jgi:tetratricopeptide (TPR) repeat protein